jgi:hypothetical protein
MTSFVIDDVNVHGAEWGRILGQSDEIRKTAAGSLIQFSNSPTLVRRTRKRKA